MTTHRLFVAIDLPNQAQAELLALQTQLPGARWVPAEQLHLTLRFLGDVEDTVIPLLTAALAGVQETPFDLSLHGVGHFPPRTHPKVLWTGVSPCEQLSSVQQQIESAVQSVGLPAEERPFSPHITLARLKETPTAAVLDFEQRHHQFRYGPLAVTAFHLYESTLTGKGAVHERRHSFPLETPRD